VVSYWAGIGLLIAAPACVVVGIIRGPIDGQSYFLWLFALFAIWFGIRCLRVCVMAGPNELVVRNYFSTRSITRDEIAAIHIAIRKGGEGGAVWMPQVRLVDGSIVWISTLEAEGAKKDMNPMCLSQLHELRQILGVAGRDADEVMG